MSSMGLSVSLALFRLRKYYLHLKIFRNQDHGTDFQLITCIIYIVVTLITWSCFSEGTYF